MAKLFLKDKPIIGVDISTTSIKVMAIDARKWLVLGYGSVDLKPDKVQEALEGHGSYLADNLHTLLSQEINGQLPSNHAVIGIPTARTYSRTFSIPASVEKNLADAVITEADQYIPLPASTLYLDHQIVERDKENITVLMSAVAKGIVDNTIAAAEAAGLHVVMTEPGISAVGRVLTATEDGHLPSVIVDIGPAGTDIAVLDGGAIRVTGSAPVGGNTFTLDIAKKMNVSLEQAHQLKVLSGLNAGPRQAKISAALEPGLQRISREIKKVMRYYEERISDDRKLEQLLVVGGGSNVPGIGDYFTNALVMPSRVASPWQRLDFGKLKPPARQFRPRYITVAGLASVSPERIWK